MKALLIPSDALKPFTVVELPNLRAMQKAVGGYIERVPLPRAASGVELYVNEDGISMKLPRNPRATLLLKALYRPHPLNMAVILGDVFICGPANGKGDLTDVPDAVTAAMEMASAPRTEFEKYLPGRFGPEGTNPPV